MFIHPARTTMVLRALLSVRPSLQTLTRRLSYTSSRYTLFNHHHNVLGRHSLNSHFQLARRTFTGMKWRDSEEIAEAMFERYPKQNPMILRFPEMRKMICIHEDFDDDPSKSNEAILEAILARWAELYQDSN